MNIKLQGIDAEKIKVAAQKQFPEYVIKLDSTDLFMKQIEDGTYTVPFHDEPIYVSTQYAYEDIMVNQNRARYKIVISTIELANHEYAVNYNWNDRYYAVYEEHNEIKFMKYVEFLSFIGKEMKPIK